MIVADLTVLLFLLTFQAGRSGLSTWRLPSGDSEIETLDWVGVNVEPQDLEDLWERLATPRPSGRP